MIGGTGRGGRAVRKVQTIVDLFGSIPEART